MLRMSRTSLQGLSPRRWRNAVKLKRKLHKIQSEEKTTKAPKSSLEIRREFLDYFLDLDHKIISSSRVTPVFDPSVAFTNAGMNQFKGIFLGDMEPPHPRVVNHQKCVRVGGKHNDLKAVGMDNYHHTFFEMLGNWSFGDYGRREACAYAWGLLTGPFGISKERLYVTYFSGDPSLELPPDLETKETWLSLGLSPSQIVPSGLQDNFWEMSVTGPCGPCTEIHINTCQNPSSSRSSDLKELWNLVFIEHQRLQDTTVQPLGCHHVDTGMGFERLVAVLQGKTSNYDTDLFVPIFDAIRRSSSAPPYQGKFGDSDLSGLDTGYRILADHARMITTCISDGMIPEENHKLRRVIRKSINVGRDVFRREKILSDVCCQVAETLGEIYPDISRNLKRVQTIVEYEEDLLQDLKSCSGKIWGEIVKQRPQLGAISDPYASGLVLGYKELQKRLLEVPGMKNIPGDLGFKLYDTYGLDPEVIEELAEVEGLGFNRKEFEEVMEKVRKNSRAGARTQESLGETDDQGKYQYSREDEGYVFQEVQAKVVGILIDGELIPEKTLHLESSLKNKQIGIILDKTSFYTPEGGQLSDKGRLRIKNLVFNVSEAQKLQNHVIHLGKFDPSNYTDKINKLSINDDVKISLDEVHRVSMMRHHTATHLLNSALRKIFPAISQRGSVVTRENLVFQFSSYGKIISPDDVKSIERLINKCIGDGVPVKTRIVDSIGFNGEEELILVPGAIYPEKNLRIVEIDGEQLKSKEACCGTHVHNTSDLKYFRIIEIASKGSSSRAITAVAGPEARDASSKILSDVPPGDSNDPNKRREMVLDFMKSEIKFAVESTTENFVVHCLPSDSIEVESFPLQKAGELYPEKPIFIIAKGKRKVRARCFVPENFVTQTFNADLWMRSVNKIFNSTLGSFDDENPVLTRHTRVLKLPKAEIHSRVKKSIEEAKEFALKNCRKP
ncbi:alanine--tRNA ligase, mitochondrial [Fopius arisanus]|uniref:Alanine--tRNA ligase n=1 Tax=Fopius arisanus TaxID=64838 RepID=A0A9R1TBS7_9HYME|nr:PREDICTED: alanine--tRNA ligase, mitochondrial [Fopius arisanus]